MDFFATGGFQQLYSDLDEQSFSYSLLSTAEDMIQLHTPYPEEQGESEAPSTGYDFYGIITLDGNNNASTEQEDIFLDFEDLGPDLCDWEQRLLDNFVEIPELVDFLPERTPLCTDNCTDFLEESNSNLRLSSREAPPPPPPPPPPPEYYAQHPHPHRKGSDGSGGGYLCTFGNCEKLYAKPAHLKAHLRRHLGEKPYACVWPECSWRFSRSDELARHRRSHSGVKPYKCDYCAKSFARSDHLTKHRKVHERRLLAATRAGRLFSEDVYSVRPGRKRKNQL
ncbi:hypothetical protein KR026_008783 [Drosophila bipectinata]|nr:hypothetical protein KR026_008783 [Drosophila bipectinata]